MVEPSPVARQRSLDSRPLLLLGYYVAAALSGATQAISDNALIYYLTSLLIAGCAVGWCVVDGRRRGRPLLPIVQLLAFLFWWIAVPIYLISTRGWRGLGWCAINFVGTLAASMIAFYSTSAIVWGSP